MKQAAPTTPEHLRLAEDGNRQKNWKRWGPYLAERQWGTVREDYSADSDAWKYFPFEQAQSRAYRWGEDGLLGVTDRECRLCFALALWNGRDPRLKERLFGLSGPEGNHGEDVKEAYFYTASTPTHSHMRAVYHYPHAEFPYVRLREENARRGRDVPEFELEDTGIFAENRYFEVAVEYAKAGPNDLLIEITAKNCGPDAATLHLLPTLWYRNTWSWGCKHEGCEVKPRMQVVAAAQVRADHASLGRFFWAVDATDADLLFTENESNAQRLFGATNRSPWVKDAINDCVVQGRADAVNPKQVGTKVAAHQTVTLAPGQTHTLRLRLYAEGEASKQPFGKAFTQVMKDRRAEAEEFYATVLPTGVSEEESNIARQAFAGLLWSKQFYHFVVADWLEGDADQPAPPAIRKNGRNSDWPHLFNRDIISMPDKWEYPWFAAWDLAFHMIPFARIDPHFAKDQLNLFLR